MKLQCFLLLAQLLSTLAQPGGGGSTESKDENTYNHSDPYSVHYFSQPTPSCYDRCYYVPAEVRNDCFKDCDSWNFTVVVGFLFFAVIFIIIAAFAGNKQRIRTKDEQISKCLQRLTITKRVSSTPDNLYTHELNLRQKKLRLVFWLQNQPYNQRDIIASQIEFLADLKALYIQFKGDDKFGSWFSNGLVIQDSDNQLYIVFYKNYDNKQKAGQTGRWSDLIYEGNYNYELRKYQGTWFYDGFQGDLNYSGFWELIEW